MSEANRSERRRIHSAVASGGSGGAGGPTGANDHELARTAVASAPGAGLDASLAAGTMVGAYRIERPVGAGGVGSVYAAVEPTIGKRVAIKVLRRGFAEDAAAVARFEREARAANDVRHPGIVDVFAIGRLTDGRPYLVMSLLEGRSLREELTLRGKLPLAEAWALAREIADALAAAHDAGIVHRDLKPENVFLETFGSRAPRPRLLDFGLAKVTEAPEGEHKLTQTGTPMGTPPYMAPEQWWGTGVDARTDQYAFGALLFEMIAGRPPFVAAKWVELVQKHLHETPPTLAEAGEAVSAEVEALVARSLAKSSADRFDSLHALVAAGDTAFGVAAAPTASGAGGRPASAPDAPRTGISPRAPTGMHPLLRCAAILVGGAGLLVAVGYAGPKGRDPLDWLHIAGPISSSMIGVLFLVACVGLARVARRREREPGRWTLWLAALPGVAGGLGTYLGWGAILSRLPRWPRTERFALFSLGAFEASASRFVGFAISALLFLSLATLVGPTGGEAPRGKVLPVAGALGLCALAAFAWVSDAPSAVLVALAAAGALAVIGHGGRAQPRSEVFRAVACLAAVGLAAAVSLARTEGRMAVLWGLESTRAERAAEVVAAAAEHTATLVSAAFSFVLVAVAAMARLRRVGSFSVRPAIAVIVVLGLAAGGDLVLHARFMQAREGLLVKMQDQFSLFGKLDPPSGRGLDARRFAPTTAPALQIARDVVAINAEGVAPLRAVESDAGALNLGRDLSHALAQPGSRDLLSVSVDRDVPWEKVVRLLRIARESGARRVELLLTRGARPTIPPSAPPEASWVLPTDFVALRADLPPGGLALEDAFRAPPGRRFGAVAPLLVQRAKGGAPLVLAVD